ncbi:MAG: ABC transporter permease [Nocardioidaceae bacterium]
MHVIPNAPLGTWVEQAVKWLQDNLGPLWDFISFIFTQFDDGLLYILTTPFPLALILAGGVLAFVFRGWKFAIFALIGLGFIRAMGQWEPAMETLALVIIATVIAGVFAIPTGILAARSRVISVLVRPVLDLMQTLPPFVYLIPAIFFFSVGVVPGIIATIIFAMPPGVRLTELGIRQVDREVVEAGEAFGSSPRRILTGIQIPLAMPTIMAGINQVIMLALSMVVIAGFVGAGGLGAVIYRSLANIDIGLGAEGGLAVVIIAIFLDRLTGALGAGGVRRGGLTELITHLTSARTPTSPVPQPMEGKDARDTQERQPAQR